MTVSWFSLLAGLVFGALLTLLWRARRESALRLELELLRAQRQTEAARDVEQQQNIARVRDQLQAAFSQLARDTLQSNNEVFLQLAGQRLAQQHSEAGQALKERESAIESLLRPIRESLSKSDSQLNVIERDRIDSFASLKTQIELLAGSQHLLARETRNLVGALRRPDVRGQWGEITLRRLVELSGMTSNVDFTEQPHVVTAEGAIRPDMIVHMPEERDIVVDVKTPLDAYLSAVEAQDDEGRARELKRHAQIVSARVRELSAKQYWTQFERSPAFVVLFLPGEQFLSAALQENPGLIDEALRQNVILATPTSLVSLLKTVAHGWKQTALAANAGEVRRLGEELYKRLAVFGEHLGRLGKSLGGSVDSFNKAVGSLEQQVLPAARRFPELGLRVTREIDPLEPVASLARIPRDGETESDDEQQPGVS
jgi:DNA recombination protein RmuC